MKPWTDFNVDYKKMWLIQTAFHGVGSDKGCHNYERVYQNFLPDFLANYVPHILELGLANYSNGSNSIRAWAKIYPTCLAYGADWKEDRMVQEPGIQTFVVDQNSTDSLDAFVKTLGDVTFDVIVDDASHSFLSSCRTFVRLLPKLKSPGVYFIEDVARKENGWQQTVADWENIRPPFCSAVIDARPEIAGDLDSVMVVIWKP